MIITYTMAAVWGVLCLGLMYRIRRSVIDHKNLLLQDQKLRDENIYIQRGSIYTLILLGAGALPFPAGVFLGHLLGGMGFHLFFDIAAFCIMWLFIAFMDDFLIAYTKISPEGTERGDESLGKISYPLKAIDAVQYKRGTALKDKDPGTVTFVTKSGARIVSFCPTDDDYFLLAMTRFKMENDRWPDMNNPEEAAQVKAWMNWSSTIPHIKDKEISGLAEVDM